MNKVIIGLLMSGLMITSACSKSTSPPVQETPNATQSSVRSSGKVVAEGRVVPAKSAALSFSASGIVAEVLATEGMRVTANQPIARLDSRRQTAAVAQADAALRRAQSRVDLLKAGARTQEIDTANAGVDAAKAQLARLEQGARPEDIAAAVANVAIAQAQLQQVQEGASVQQIEAAAADLANALAAVKQRQAEYDRVAQEPGIGARPESLALEQATNAFRVAKARYDDLVKGATASSLGLATARVQQAVAQLNAVKASARPAELDLAKADLRRAQAQLDLVKSGARIEDLSSAQADVDSANAALDQAKVSLSETELKAPFAGTVALVNVKVGEQVVAGTVVARIGDPSAWEIETTDLTELNISSVKEGSRASITIDALPGVELSGKVARIRQYGESKQGDIVYTVVVAPDSHEERLRWNMTASVTLEP